MRANGAGTPFDWPEAIGYGRQPFACVPAGRGALTAGPDGAVFGIFGWADPVTGEVSNSLIDGGFLGIVLPIVQWWNWQRAYPQRGPDCSRQIVLRPGTALVLASQGDFIVRFPLPVQAGAAVYVDPATGLPYGANPGGYVRSAWVAMRSACGCGERVRISSFATAFN